MKHLAFMIVLTVIGTLGVFTHGPFWGLLVYDLFGVLRPQFLWQWDLPLGVPWSFYVAIATILGTVFQNPEPSDDDDAYSENARTGRLTWAHYAVLAFGAWVVLTYFTARHPEVSYPYLIEYLKLFLMFLVATFIVRQQWQMEALYVVITLCLVYIAYEVNYIYFFQGHYLIIWRRGYCGLDNNGAGLMLAMAVPLCFFAWEGIAQWWRWLFLLFIPPIVHAVLMSYSRGAMIALIAGVPFYVWRSRYKIHLTVILLVIGSMVPVLAGNEIQKRFFSISEYEADGSAQSRLTSWSIGWRMAREKPIFGFGIRNSNLYTFDYGADIPGRTIHSLFLQIAADSGIVALGLYLLTIFTVWRSTVRVIKATRRNPTPTQRRAYAMACGIESSLLVFCLGAVFLSLETFELPYIILFLGAQLPLVVRKIVPRPVEDELEQDVGELDPNGPKPYVNGGIEMRDFLARGSSYS